jgi:cytochrome c oxidase subunit 2
MKKIKYLSILLSTLLLTASLPAFAQETGKPFPWQLNLQEAVSPTAMRIGDFHDMMLIIIFAISIFVLLLLIWVVIRYNSKMNPEPSQFTHNVLLEVLWTGLPVIILIIIAIPSFKLLYYADRVENPDMTLKIIGRQWYWDYEYPDHGDVAFSAYMIADADIDTSKGENRLLSTDAKIVLPIDTNIAIQITAGDVLHAWTVPAFGVKLDAVPGRLNETWVRIEKEGVYYGQCSELCGKDHAYMPIEVHAVSKEKFEQWITIAKDDIDAAQAMNVLEFETAPAE